MKEEVQKYLIEILTRIKGFLPDGKHCFQLGDDGRLWLWVNTGKEFQSIIFDENYEDITPEKLVDEVIESLKGAGYKIASV